MDWLHLRRYSFNLGMLAVQDANGSVKILIDDCWQQIYKDKQFWLIGIIDYELIGIKLNKNEMEPIVFPRP